MRFLSAFTFFLISLKKKIVLSLALFMLFSLSLQGTTVFSGTLTGGMSWTGNTLGLSKVSNQNNPGASDSIGAFITLNTLLKQGSYPFGTTLDWTINSSSATLDLPPNSTVVYAELIWGGSFGYNPAIVGSVLDTPVTFITPDSVSHTVTRNPLTSGTVLLNNTPNGIYSRSSNVTSLVTGPGVYSVSGVPGTVVATQNNLNCAGWTLAVVYENANMLTNKIDLFVAARSSASSAVLLTNFTSPITGSVSGRLFLTALEGDANISGDHFLVGPTSSLSYPTNAVFGTNNPINNFFASQINTLLPLTVDPMSGKLVSTGSSVLDTRGTFGLSNQNALTGANISGGRQGYDITSIDISNKLVNGQTSIYTQPTTNGDAFVATAYGLQIQVEAPVIIANKSVNPMMINAINDVLTFTATFENTSSTLASLVIFKDFLDTGLTYQANSLTIDTVPSINQDLDAGVPLGDLAPGDTITVVFNAIVTAYNTDFSNTASILYEFLPVGSLIPVPTMISTNTVDIPSLDTPIPVAFPDSYMTTAGFVLNGTSVLANDTGQGLSVQSNTAPVQPGAILSVATDGTFVYESPPNFSGQDSFEYTLVDAANQTSSTTVTIDVFPYALPDDVVAIANETLIENTSVLINDIGSDLFVLAYDTMSMEGGTVVMTPLGTYTYTPPLNFIGSDSFNYTISDSSGNTSATVVSILVVFGVPTAPLDFVGTVKESKFIDRTIYPVVMTWDPPLLNNVSSYRIYLDGQLVATISATQPRIFRQCVNSKSAANLFQITAVSPDNQESVPANITILP